MRLSHLCFGSWDRPNSGFEVKFFPNCASEFSRADEQMRSEGECMASGGVALVAVDRSKQFTDFGSFQDRGPVLRPRRRQSSFEISCRIRL